MAPGHTAALLKNPSFWKLSRISHSRHIFWPPFEQVSIVVLSLVCASQLQQVAHQLRRLTKSGGSEEVLVPCT
jgi:hypothetical protein